MLGQPFRASFQARIEAAQYHHSARENQTIYGRSGYPPTAALLLCGKVEQGKAKKRRVEKEQERDGKQREKRGKRMGKEQGKRWKKAGKEQEKMRKQREKRVPDTLIHSCSTGGQLRCQKMAVDVPDISAWRKIGNSALGQV